LLFQKDAISTSHCSLVQHFVLNIFDHEISIFVPSQYQLIYDCMANLKM